MSNPTEQEVGELLQLYGGDVEATAATLKVSPAVVAKRIYKSPQLRAAFGQAIGISGDSSIVEPTGEDEQIMRNVTIPSASDNSEKSKIIAAMQVQNIDLIADGLQRNGISKETVDKLKSLGKIEQSAAQFLVGSLDMMHRMVVYTGASLMEQAENIRTEYLDPKKAISMKERLVWQRLYNQVVDQMGKSYDRVLNGTTAMVKLTTPKGKDEGAKSKPGFRPLKKADA
jgi:hypothetical protein